jgi:hypothetical protein
MFALTTMGYLVWFRSDWCLQNEGNMTHPRAVLLPLVLIGLLVVSGRSGLQAKSATATLIAADVPLMQGRIATTQPAPALASNAERFAFYYDTATVNWFAWAFCKDKSIYCTATIYRDLMQKKALSAEYSRRMSIAASQPTYPTNPTGWLTYEATWMTNIHREQQGR